MTDVFRLLKVLELPLELLAAAAVFAWPLVRRKRVKWALFPGGAAVLWGLYEVIAYQFLIPHLEGTLLQLLLSLLLSAVSFGTAAAAICAFREVTPVTACYYATLAYLAQHFAYCACEFVFPGILFTDEVGQSTEARIRTLLLVGCVFAISYFGIWRLAARPLSRSGRDVPGVGRSLAVMIVGLSTCLGLSVIVQFFLSKESALYRCCLAYAMLCCALLLWNQVDLHNRLRQQHELDTQRQLWLRHKAQYERAQAGVKLINHKCHALKRQLGAFEQLAATAPDEATRTSIRKMAKTVSVYDSIVETGNEILDTILSEKSLQCAAQNIAFSCVADGRAVEFVGAVELFSMLGAALDNAWEAVQKLPDAKQRAISVSIFSGQGVSILEVENFYTGPLTFGSDGLPVTTKGDSAYYGFGLRNIRQTAEKYGGVLTVRAEDGIFLLRVTLPNGQ